MRDELVPQLRCPACRTDGSLVVLESIRDEREMREGTLRCNRCARRFPLRRGVVELLYEPAPYIVAEADGLGRFAEWMRAQGWDHETVLKLPDVEDGYWYVQARSMHQLLTTIHFVPGQSVLDVGSNTCWATNHFAERGLRAIALDIATADLQGLYTADHFLERGNVYFERILGTMDAIPLASSSLDYVYCCEVLHHNDVAALARTFSEVFRVLRPGGRLLMVNETLKTLRDPHGVHLEGVAEFEGNEHAHWAWTYRLLAARAGFFTDVTEPHYRPFFGDAELSPDPQLGRLPRLARSAGFALRNRRLARRLYLEWLNDVAGGVSMNMVATKPTRWVGNGHAGPTERAVRTAAAATRLSADRREGLAPPRALRSPEEAAAAALVAAAGVS